MTNLNNLTIVTLTDAINTLRKETDTKPMKKAESKAKAIAEIEKRSHALRLIPVITDDAVTFEPAPVKKSRQAHNPEAIIVVLRSCPPKKGGRNPYEFYQTGQTVQEFVDAGGKVRDVNYDVDPDRKGGAVIQVFEPDCYEAVELRAAYEAGDIPAGWMGDGYEWVADNARSVNKAATEIAA